MDWTAGLQAYNKSSPDKIILMYVFFSRSLEDLGQKEQTDQVTYLKEELRNARTELK